MNDGPQATQKPAGNGPNALLTTLATSGNKGIQFGVLILVGLSGLGNWLGTQNAARDNLAGQAAIRIEIREQISDIHRWQQANYNWVRQSTDEFHKANDDSAESRKILEKLITNFRDTLAAQTQMLKNQTEMLKNQNIAMANDSKILDELARAVSSLTIKQAYPSPTPGAK